MRARQALRTAAAIGAAAAVMAGCSSVGIGIGFPIGRIGGITIGGSIPIPPREPAASAPGTAASAAAAQDAAASAPAGK